MRIAVLLTCYNRRQSTILCLTCLGKQELPPKTNIATYLVDDGCTDGTALAVSERFPGVRIVTGDGTLYWCGGMRRAWAEAMPANYDAYLWLNDDTLLVPAALKTLTAAYESVTALGKAGIIVGSTCDPETGQLSYGGLRGR
ncbi:MAG: glycosyltransferase, partial [Acidobacteriia bacterium]|nr:glycosyltransferase [Terriglobia bacterium]